MLSQKDLAKTSLSSHCAQSSSYIRIVLNVFLFSLLLLASISAQADDCPPEQEPDEFGQRHYQTYEEGYKAAWCHKVKDIRAHQADPDNHVYGDYPMDYETPCYDKSGNYAGSLPMIRVYFSNSHDGFRPSSRIPSYGCGATTGGYYSGGVFRVIKKCLSPFYSVDGECITYCPADKPNLDLATGSCFNEKDKKEPNEQCAANPVIVASGEKIQTELDLELSSPFPIRIERQYRSNRIKEAEKRRAKVYHEFVSTSKPIAGVSMVKHVQPGDYSGIGWTVSTPQFGYKFIDGIKYVGFESWLYTHNAELKTNGSIVTIDVANNRDIFERNNDGFYQPRNLRNVKLTELTNDPTAKWSYTAENGEIYRFDSKNRLIQRINDNGFVHNYEELTSDTNGFRIRISDQFQNWIIVTSNTNFVSGIEASNGISIKYAYDNVSGNLISVTKSIESDPNNPEALTELIKTYHYENADFPYALTGITDEKGVRFATWSYDEIGRAIQSVHTDNNDKTSFVYEDNSTTVTNALGKKTKYNYTVVAGAKRLTNVEGLATELCAASNKAYTYYSNGRIRTQTDWEGNVTYFEYNDRGQVTKRTDAYGTPEASSEETTWHESLNKPVLIKYPDRSETFRYTPKGLLINKNTESR